eukprot:TRINITY_DN93429_c0_g1_i1.p1 TRINITY_DN93429_c0_g1~~TRINITY_DN93429_c0_g1_i1.p1  ORF type:complete len:482 (-),score=118.32 TRINITY_DN93429_c0_g1_i1:31-1476(-)
MMRSVPRLANTATPRTFNQNINALLPRTRPPHQFTRMETIDPKKGVAELYRDIMKGLPYVKLIFEVPLSLDEMRKRVRAMFDEYAGVTDPEAIRQLIIQGSSDFNEVIHHVATQNHVFNYFNFTANKTDFKDYLRIVDPKTPTWKALEMQTHNADQNFTGDQKVIFAKRTAELEQWNELSLQEKLEFVLQNHEDIDTVNLRNPKDEVPAMVAELQHWTGNHTWEAAIQKVNSRHRRDWEIDTSPESDQKYFKEFLHQAGIQDPHASLHPRGEALRVAFGRFKDDPLHRTIITHSAYQCLASDSKRVPALRGPYEHFAAYDPSNPQSYANTADQEANPLTNRAAYAKQYQNNSDRNVSWELPVFDWTDDLGVKYLSDLVGIDPRADVFLRAEIEYRQDLLVHVQMNIVRFMLQRWPHHAAASALLRKLENGEKLTVADHEGLPIAGLAAAVSKGSAVEVEQILTKNLEEHTSKFDWTNVVVL